MSGINLNLNEDEIRERKKIQHKQSQECYMKSKYNSIKQENLFCQTNNKVLLAIVQDQITKSNKIIDPTVRMDTLNYLYGLEIKLNS